MAAMATAAILTIAAPAGAASAPAGSVPKLDKVTAVVAAEGRPVSISRQQYLANARAAGMTASQLKATQAAIASSGCWYWHTYVYYKNIFHTKILQYNLEPNWCSSGRRITSAFTDRWGQTFVPGWSYNGYGNYHHYGVGWNVYVAGGHGHFCFVRYFDCVQNKYTWIEDEVGAGGRTIYFHWSG
jgi:hypothetical protein